MTTLMRAQRGVRRFALILLFGAHWALGAETVIDAGIGWYASERGRSLESTLPALIDPDGAARTLSNQTLILSRLSGPTLNTGVKFGTDGWWFGLSGSIATPGMLRGAGFDRDYYRLEGPRYGLRWERGGPTTGDSVYASHKNLTWAQAPYDEFGSRMYTNASIGYEWDGDFTLSMSLGYEDLEIENRSPGYATVNTWGGPELRPFYAPLSYTLRDFRRSLGIEGKQGWSFGAFGLDLRLGGGAVDEQSRYRLYTRNASLLWFTHGWYFTAGLGFDYRFGQSGYKLFALIDAYRSSSIGRMSYSEIGKLTFTLQGYSIAPVDIARIDERRMGLKLGLEFKL